METCSKTLWFFSSDNSKPLTNDCLAKKISRVSFFVCRQEGKGKNPSRKTFLLYGSRDWCTSQKIITGANVLTLCVCTEYRVILKPKVNIYNETNGNDYILK